MFVVLYTKRGRKVIFHPEDEEERIGRHQAKALGKGKSVRKILSNFQNGLTLAGCFQRDVLFFIAKRCHLSAPECNSEPEPPPAQKNRQTSVLEKCPFVVEKSDIFL